MCPYMPWGGKGVRSIVLHSKRRRLGPRIGGIGSNIREGLIYLSETDNFFEWAGATAESRPHAAKTLSKWVDCRE